MIVAVRLGASGSAGLGMATFCAGAGAPGVGAAANAMLEVMMVKRVRSVKVRGMNCTPKRELPISRNIGRIRGDAVPELELFCCKIMWGRGMWIVGERGR